MRSSVTIDSTLISDRQKYALTCVTLFVTHVNVLIGKKAKNGSWAGNERNILVSFSRSTVLLAF